MAKIFFIQWNKTRFKQSTVILCHRNDDQDDTLSLVSTLLVSVCCSVVSCTGLLTKWSTICWSPPKLCGTDFVEPSCLHLRPPLTEWSRLHLWLYFEQYKVTQKKLPYVLGIYSSGQNIQKKIDPEIPSFLAGRHFVSSQIILYFQFLASQLSYKSAYFQN